MHTHSEPSPVGPLRSIQWVAEYLGVDRSSVRRYIDRGDLQTIKIGGRRLVAESDLRAFVEAHREA